MRITGQNPVSGVQGRGSKKRSGNDGGVFSPDVGGEEAASASVSSSSGIQGMDALLALQEVDEDPGQRRRAASHGHALLDKLEEIRADLLAGHVSEERLEALSEQVSTQVESGDPQVDEVLREIELRVKVELAKLGRFTD